ncbi:class I SAM-dependent methyltransferase [Actinoplanes sp. NPDC049118]|uniref:class I SAM-dependent methyltransferase n=1 Tax=Actinoplanes sp. NPDC049118 TaxID=3155769 RepID=UPI0033FB9827
MHITQRLDPDLWNAVAKVLTTLGGSYQARHSAFTFGYDCRPAVRQVIKTGEYRSPAQAEGYVPTPEVLAEELTTEPFSDLARMPAGSRVLEPSAGDGQLVRAILEANDEIQVVAIEPNTERAALVGGHGGRVTVVNTSFEEYAASAGKDARFDAVVMNPPFTLPGQRAAVWIDHVMLAWNMLEPGGRLVAVVPAGLAFREDQRHRDMRQLADDFGGWAKLPNDTSPGGQQTCVIWLARPVPGQEGRPPWLFRHYPDAIEPVRVKVPWLTTRAVQQAPVQVWHDTWSNEDRVFRYRAQCWRCGWLLWEFDGADDQALGNHAAHSCLRAEEHDKAGLTVGLCFNCFNDRESNDGAFTVAQHLWRQPPTKAAATSVWSLLLSRGGMIPVDSLERERYTRVQAALRVVAGVDDAATEVELIEARQAGALRGGPDRIAAAYLRAYADRLDPVADLDDADRAALLWRTDPDAPAIAVTGEPDPWGAVLAEIEHLEWELNMVS